MFLFSYLWVCFCVKCLLFQRYLPQIIKNSSLPRKLRFLHSLLWSEATLARRQYPLGCPCATEKQLHITGITTVHFKCTKPILQWLLQLGSNKPLAGPPEPRLVRQKHKLAAWGRVVGGRARGEVRGWAQKDEEMRGGEGRVIKALQVLLTLGEWEQAREC